MNLYWQPISDLETNDTIKPRIEFGDHYLVDFEGCDPQAITLVEPTREILIRAARDCGATLVDDRFHQYEPFGVSGIILIAESHFSVHTWPEDCFVAVDIFTSGTTMDPAVAIEIMTSGFGAKGVNVRQVTRGKLCTS